MEASGQAPKPHLGHGLHGRDDAPWDGLSDPQRGRRVHPTGAGSSGRQIIGTHDVLAELEGMVAANGKPKIVRCDNGREFIATTLRSWLAERGIAVAYIEKGQPQQNCFVEQYNGTMRNEVLANEDFDTVLEARIILQKWALEEYNTRRPHRGHGMLTPRQFADRWKVGRR